MNHSCAFAALQYREYNALAFTFVFNLIQDVGGATPLTAIGN